MNKIINGKRYDTETARQLGEYENMAEQRNFGHWSQTLYRTRSGNYFLYCEGGGLSQYATRRGDNSGWGEQIEPYTLEEAQKWAEKYLNADEYEAIFGGLAEIPAEEESEQIKISLPVSMLRELREKRESTGATVSWLIIKALKDAGYGAAK